MIMCTLPCYFVYYKKANQNYIISVAMLRTVLSMDTKQCRQEENFALC